MITIQNIKKEVLAHGGDNGDTVQGEIRTRNPCVIYINYTKGNESSLELTFDVYFSRLDDYYPVMTENASIIPLSVAGDSDSSNTYQPASVLVRLSSDSDGSSLEPLIKIITNSGKYRFIIPVLENERGLRVNARFVDATSGCGSALITILPISIAV